MRRGLFWFCLLAIAASLVATAGPAGAGSKRPRNGRFFAAVPDARLCPLCGGYFVSAVNRDLTRCADRSRAETCYVIDVDWSRTGLSDSEIAELRSSGVLLLRGRLKRTRLEAIGRVGLFRAREVWGAAGPPGRILLDEPPQAEGELYVRLRDNGIRCITAPCAQFEMSLLNRKRRETRTVDEVDLSAVEATEAERQAATDAFTTPQGLLALGRLEPFEVRLGPPGEGMLLQGTRFVAAEFFLPGTSAPRR